MLLPTKYEYKGFEMYYGTDDAVNKGEMMVWDEMPNMKIKWAIVQDEKVADYINALQDSFKAIIDKHLKEMMKSFEAIGRVVAHIKCTNTCECGCRPEPENKMPVYKWEARNNLTSNKPL